MNKLSVVKAMTGMSIVGRLYMETEKNISQIPFALAGAFDGEIYHGFYYITYGADIEYRENDSRVIAQVENLKSYLRNFVNGIFEAAARQDFMEKQNRLRQVQEELRSSNRPSEFGTVSEIAQKLGISKSEVRRRKAEGTLAELFDNQST